MAVGIRGLIAHTMSATAANLQRNAQRAVDSSQSQMDGSEKKLHQAKEKKRKRKWFGRTFLRGRDKKRIALAEIGVKERQLAVKSAERFKDGAGQIDDMVGQFLGKQFRETLQKEKVG